MRDIVHYVDRVVIPYRPRAVVLFAGTKDIAWSRPAKAQEVFDGYVDFVRQLRSVLPEVPIYYVSITPTPSRWRYWPIVREANRLIRAHAQVTPGLRYIDLTDAVEGPGPAAMPLRMLLANAWIHRARRAGR
jgi:hypothetical protein